MYTYIEYPWDIVICKPVTSWNDAVQFGNGHDHNRQSTDDQHDQYFISLHLPGRAAAPRRWLLCPLQRAWKWHRSSLNWDGDDEFDDNMQSLVMCSCCLAANKSPQKRRRHRTMHARRRRILATAVSRSQLVSWVGRTCRRCLVAAVNSASGTRANFTDMYPTRG